REETRYRLLFQVATDAVVVVDAESGRIVDANPAASNLLSVGRRELLGRSLKEDLGWQSPPAIAAMLAAALESNRGGEMPARLVGNAQPLLVSATPFRGLTDMLLLVRVRAAQGAEDNEPVAREDDDNDSAVVVTDSSGRILMSNQLFAQWCEVPGEASIRGESIGRWLDSISGGVPALLESVRARGISSETECVIVGKGRRTKKLMLSAALLTDEDQERIGFVLTRAVHALDDPPLSVASSSAGALEELVGQIGNTGLVDLVAAASAIVERSAIEHAWTRAVGDLDATARLLRISSTELQQRIGTLGIVLGAFGADVSTTSKSH
ncbi:MAG: PAS domain-containing protein, partial [Burkholderiaceae bacterium]